VEEYYISLRFFEACLYLELLTCESITFLVEFLEVWLKFLGKACGAMRACVRGIGRSSTFAAIV
jgi:hypothetical protein